eukprot:GFUD01045043.1.p2 GENE.GFUD01045043.1~~GFUD01045043.1.p2  ORF type:complete len:105 (-),score=19.27 GFUD01045043.1:15-329(-)
MHLPGPSSFAMIPPEILQKIFENLDFQDLNSAVLVCKGWKCVGESPRFWRKIQIEVPAKDFETVVEIPRLSQIEHLILRTGTIVKTKITFNFDTINKPVDWLAG